MWVGKGDDGAVLNGGRKGRVGESHEGRNPTGSWKWCRGALGAPFLSCLLISGRKPRVLNVVVVTKATNVWVLGPLLLTANLYSTFDSIR